MDHTGRQPQIRQRIEVHSQTRAPIVVTTNAKERLFAPIPEMIETSFTAAMNATARATARTIKK
jgi:hypothetical protein